MKFDVILVTCLYVKSFSTKISTWELYFLTKSIHFANETYDCNVSYVNS